MKKILALVLTICTVFSMNMTAFAQGYDIFFDGNGGTFNCYMDQLITTSFYGDFIEAGTKLGDDTNKILTNPVFWDSSRQFLGWMPNEMVDVPGGFNTIPLANAPISSSAALNYTMPNHRVLFIAQWAGDDSDYFSEVMIHGFGGKVPYTFLVGTENGMTYVDGEEEEMWYYLKENNETLATQVSNDFIIKGDPVKAGATFEGWLEVSYTAGLNVTPVYEYVSDKLYTTNELKDMKTREKDTLFIAKWSDMTLKEYYDYLGIKVEEEKEEQRVEIQTGLNAVPENISNKYASVNAIETALKNTALNTNSGFSTDDAKSILLDVELQYKDNDGTWKTVTYDNFPAEGVDVVLPYPEGTNKDDYQFVITHMITAGEKAGEVEVLKGELKEDGIHVKFTSMSPVMITYQVKNVEDTSDGVPGESTDDTLEEAPEVIIEDSKAPETGDTSNIWSTFAALLVSGCVMVVLMLRKKSMN